MVGGTTNANLDLDNAIHLVLFLETDATIHHKSVHLSRVVVGTLLPHYWTAKRHRASAVDDGILA